MNFLLAGLLFFLVWWFAEQGLYFFSMVFVIVLVLTAIASGQKAPAGAPAAGPAAAGYGTPPAPAPAEPKWDNTQIEAFGRNLARVIELPLRIIWGGFKWLFGFK